MRTMARLIFAAVALAGCAIALAAEPAARDFRDVVYAAVDGKPLGLDIHLPAGVREPRLLVWVHGGAWTTGNKTAFPAFLVEGGFAVASLDFRSSNDAKFPANVHDIKAGIRFLRAKAKEYGYRADRIGIVGASSGGHLAALVGVTSGNKELEGSEGDYLNESSSVQAIVSYFGATDLTTILPQSTPDGLAVRAPALERLFGAPPDKVPELAKLASPIFHVDRDDPPAFLLHGDQDLQMPVNQVLEMKWAYENVGRNIDMLILHGVDHVAPPFFAGKPVDQVVRFLKRNLR
ncbi:MAG: alpha/beta hydrolase [Gammaproteobacteria bacterium]